MLILKASGCIVNAEIGDASCGLFSACAAEFSPQSHTLKKNVLDIFLNYVSCGLFSTSTAGFSPQSHTLKKNVLDIFLNHTNCGLFSTSTADFSPQSHTFKKNVLNIFLNHSNCRLFSANRNIRVTLGCLAATQHSRLLELMTLSRFSFLPMPALKRL